MTHQSWDLLSNLLYGRPGQRLPDYVARRAGEIDVYLRDMHLPATSPVVLAHAESIIAIYRQAQQNTEQWSAVQKALDNISVRLDRIERRLAPPAQVSTPSGPARPQAQASSQPSGALGPIVEQPSDSLFRRFWRAVKDWFWA